MTLPNTRRNDNPTQELDFDQPVVNIGSHLENDVKVAGAGVLPFHAMVIRQGDSYQLVPLSVDANVLVDGQSVNTSGIGLTENQPVQIGDYTLAFRRNGTPTSVHVVMAQTGSVTDNQTAVADGDSAIIVNALTRLVDIQVDQTATYQIEVINAGPIVASFSVRLQGAPSEWVEINPRTFNLNEQQKITVTIKVNPPRSPESTAGKHPLTILVSSPNYPRNQINIPVDLIIQPYFQFTLGTLSPRQQHISYRKRVGTTRLPITNQGNGDADFSVTAQDEENGCNFDFNVSKDLQLNKQATVNIPAGTTLTLPIEITPLKRSVFAWANKRYQYTSTVRVADQPVTPQIVSGSVSSSPLFGWWSIVLGLIFIGVLIFLALIPRIYSFDVVAGKDVIELNDTTNLEWSVSPFATNLSITGIETAINYGQTSLAVAPKASITYELTASNYLSGLVGLNQKKSQTVLVVPPQPVINVFEVDNTSVARGKAVKIRYSVSQADTAVLNIGGVVTTLTPDKFSGEQSVVLDNDSLITLEARNVSGSQLRSYLINVVEPKVTINTYTVWVRPSTTTPAAATSMTPSSAAKAVAALSGLQLMSLPLPLHTLPSQGLNAVAPSDSFTKKLVELVPDKTSETGYRVQFDDATRQLAKGEQVMIEWNVDGTDTQSIQIAPFTDILPNKGRQPFFPQASMNFVMTAQSGDQKKIFMLPVVVFDGTPPAAPKIDIFQASPMSMVGPGTVQFAWSVSGAWTRIQLANGKGIVADYLNPQGFKKVTVSASDTFILTAWNGTLSAATPINITVNPALLSIPINITGFFPQTGKFLTGDKISVTVDLPALPATTPPTPAPTGKVIISDGVASCSFVLPVKSCDLYFITPGIKSLVASYAGDSVYAQADSAPFTGGTLVPPTSIDVAAATVNLTPSYFNLIRPSSAGSNITDITNPSPAIELDSGLYIQVGVKPVSTVIPNDAFSHVRLSICNQDTTGNVILASCYLITQAPVVVASNGGSGLATIVLSAFPKDIVVIGTHTFLFEYRHDNNALLPATLAQKNITINKMSIGLKLAACATDSIQFTGCVVNGTNTIPSAVLFDIIRPDGTPLTIDLPQPEALYSLYDDGGTGGNHPWVCTIIENLTSSGGSYQLSCTPQLTNFSVTVHFSFNGASSQNYNSWSGQPASFTLNRKTPTTVSLDAIGSPVKVGQLFTLTNSGGAGLVHLLDANNAVPSGVQASTLHLTFSDPTFIGVANASAGGCSASGSVLTIVGLTSNCQFYFAKKGTVTVTLNFDGDGNLASSAAASQTITVNTQDGVTATWQYLIAPSTSYNSWTLTTIKPLVPVSIQILLAGPSGFAPESIAGQTLNVPFTLTSGAGSCSGITGAIGTAKPNPVPVTAVTGGYGADFNWTCSPVNMHFTLGSLLIGDGSSFAFASGQDLPKTLVTADRPTAALSVSMKRSADSNEAVGSGTLGTLYAGEPYSLSFTVGPLSADAFTPSTSIQQAMDYYQNNVEVQIVLPTSLKNQIDWSHSTCESTSGAHDLLVKLNDAPVVIHDYGFPSNVQGLHDVQANNTAHPCQLEFNLNSPIYADILTAGEQASFTLLPSPLYAPNYNNTISYTAIQAYNWLGLKRQDVQATFSPNLFSTSSLPNDTGIIGSPSQAIGMKISGASGVTGSSHQTFDTSSSYASQIDYSFPSCATPVITDGLITNSFPGFSGTTVGTEVLHYPDTSCSGVITMSYLGNAWYKPITGSAKMTFNNAPATTTAITAPTTGATSGYPSTLDFTAHVALTAGGITPTGTIQFNDGATPLGSPVTLDGSGNASLTNPSLSAATHSITASFISDQPLNYGNSVSSAITVTVNPAATNTVLTSNPTTWTANGSEAFTATVSAVNGSAGTPTGSVDFVESGSGTDVILNTANLSSGVATFNTSLGSGNHIITAKYHASVNGNFANSTSVSLSQNLSLPQTLTLASQSSYAFGQQETFTATFSSTSPAPTGTVTFWQQNGGSAVSFGSQAATTAVSGVVTFQPVTSLPYSATHYSVYATFTPASGSPYNLTTSNTLSIAITKVQTSIYLSPPPSSSTINWGDQVAFTANVTGPNGTAQLYDGVSTLGPSFAITSGSGSFTTTTPLEPGVHNITAQFTPTDTANYANSTTPSSISVTVNKIATSVTITQSTTSTSYGDNITFGATTTGALTGSLQFKDTINNVTSNLGSAVTVTGGTISPYTVASLTATGHSITAVFTPTDTTHYNASNSTNTLTQTVNKAPTNIKITPSANPNTYGSLTYTVSVTTSANALAQVGAIAGSATFTYDGFAFSGSSTITASAGSFFAGGLAVAGSPHAIVATFAPSNTNLAGSTSSTLFQTVNILTTTTLLESTIPTSNYGDSVQFKATPSSGSSQPGSVDFFVDSSASPTATVALSGGVAIYQTNSLSAGNHSVYAVFNPDNAPSVTGSTSSTINQVVTIITTSVGTIEVSPSSPKKTETLTLTVLVSDTNGTATPYGTVTFYLDSNLPANELSHVTITSGGSGSSLTYRSTGGTGGTAVPHTIIAVFTPANTTNFIGDQNTLLLNFLP